MPISHKSIIHQKSSFLTYRYTTTTQLIFQLMASDHKPILIFFDLGNIKQSETIGQCAF